MEALFRRPSVLAPAVPVAKQSVTDENFRCDMQLGKRRCRLLKRPAKTATPNNKNRKTWKKKWPSFLVQKIAPSLGPQNGPSSGSRKLAQFWVQKLAGISLPKKGLALKARKWPTIWVQKMGRVLGPEIGPRPRRIIQIT